MKLTSHRKRVFCSELARSGQAFVVREEKLEQQVEKFNKKRDQALNNASSRGNAREPVVSPCSLLFLAC